MSDDNQQAQGSADPKKSVAGNLVNMRDSDDIYSQESKRVIRLLGSSQQALAESIDMLRVVAGDVFYSFYSVSPTIGSPNPNPILEVVRTIMGGYMQGEEFKKVREATMLNEDATVRYTVSTVNNILKAVQEQMAALSDQNGDSDGEGSLKKMMQKAKENDKTAQQQLEELFIRALRKLGKAGFTKAMEKALKESNVDVGDKDLSTSERAPNPYGLQRVNYAEEILALTKKLVSYLPRIAENSSVKSPYGDRIAGYRMTKNPAKAIAKEHAMPDEVFYGKMDQGWLAKDKFIEYEGAYYVLIDKSGSMEMPNSKTIWARSVAMTLFEQSKRRGQEYFLRLFDGQTSLLVRKPEEIEEAILRVKSGGSTDIDKAIGNAFMDLTLNKELSKKTNTIVLITDGLDGVAEDWKEKFKQAKVRLVTIMIRGESEPQNEALRKISDAYYSVVPTKDAALEVLKEMRRQDEKSRLKSV